MARILARRRCGAMTSQVIDAMQAAESSAPTRQDWLAAYHPKEIRRTRGGADMALA